MLFAALDFGTNTLRLLVKDAVNKQYSFRKNYYLLLGKECKDGELSKAGIAKLKHTLSEIKIVLQNLGVSKVFGVATAFARSLTNQQEFINTIVEVIDCDIRLIDGKTEGAIVSLAVKEYFNITGEFLILDIGGGSTEFIIEKKKQLDVISIDMGSLYLTENFFSKYPPDISQIQNLVDFVKINLTNIRESFENKNVFGVGGTITTLAYILSGEKSYLPEKINGFLIKYVHVKDFYEKIKNIGQNDLLNNFSVESGREKVLLAGTLELLTIMETFKIKEIIASDVSLIDGVIPFFKKNAFSSL